MADLFNDGGNNNQKQNRPSKLNYGDLNLEEPKKSNIDWKKIILVSGLSLVVLVSGVFGVKLVMENLQANQEMHQQTVNIEAEKERVYNGFFTSLRSFSTSQFMALPEGELSYLDQERVYTSEFPIRQKFVDTVFSTVKQIQDGYSYVNWDYVNLVMQNIDYDKLREMYKNSEIKEGKYDYYDKVVDLFAKYITENLLNMLDKTGDYAGAYLDLFGSAVDVEQTTLAGSLVVNGDTVVLSNELVSMADKNLFGSEKFHRALDVFILVASGKIGDKIDSQAHKDWVSQVGTLKGLISDLEAKIGSEDYVNNMNNLSSLPISNYLKELQTLKDTLVSQEYLLSTYEPSRYTIKTTDVARGYLPQSLMPYDWVGAYYLQNEHKDKDGILKKVKPTIGDGTYDSPAYEGTMIETYAQDVKGDYKPVKVALQSVVTGEEAIKRALELDSRNQGFTENSQNKLGIVTVTVQNIGTETIEINSELSLSDSSQNIIPRTGSLFGTIERIKLEPGQSVDIVDWFFAPSVDISNLVWGKTFNRKYDMVWFNALANKVLDGNGYRLDRVEKEKRDNKAQEHQDKLIESVENLKNSASSVSESKPADESKPQ